MKNLFLAITAVALGVIAPLHAQQDKHFSMFAESPVFLNPATAGFAPEQLQLFTNFRTQWVTVSEDPYRTISASADWRMFDQNGNKSGSFLGAGINFYNDRAGVSNYTTNVISFPINYALQVGLDDHLSFGLQPAYFQRTINASNLTWDNQWTGTSFDQGILSNEQLLSQNINITRFDMAAGVFWEKRVNRYSSFNLGISGQHLTRQRVNILSDDSRLYRKLTIHGQGDFQAGNSNVSIQPAFVSFVQGPNSAFTLGSAFKFLLKGESKHTAYFNNMHLTLGSYFRVKDAVIATAAIEFHTFSFGMAYDLNISRLSVASKGVGAMEFYLRYRLNYEGRTLAHPTIKK